MNTKITFRDREKCSVSVEYNSDRSRRYISFSGDSGNSCGQIYDEIIPRTASQKRLVSLWKKFNLKPILQEQADKLDRVVKLVFDRLQQEEAEYTHDLGYPVVLEEFLPNEEELLEQMKNVLQCSQEDVIKAYALGVHLNCTAGDIMETFIGSDNEYTVNGIDYYVGSYEELTALARNQLLEDDYFWREAVRANQTELGLVDWADSIIREVGFAGILNSWDNRYDAVEIDDEIVYICRR